MDKKDVAVAYLVSLVSIEVYLACVVNSEFHKYINGGGRLSRLKVSHTQCIRTPMITLYRLFGRNHREDGPAKILYNGDRMWYRDGELHRVGGPAIMKADGTRFWFRAGELYRDPAIDGHGPIASWPDGTHLWDGGGEVDDTPSTIKDTPSPLSPDLGDPLVE